ncbi:MAG: substrate-binding domain-containing protein, partial [Bryobacteraceae bacterium]
MRFLRICLVVALGLTAACRRETKRTIAMIPMGNAHQYWQSVHAGAVKAARELGVNVIWDGPPTETDFAGQLKIVDTMINRHVDAIAVAPIDTTTLVNVVERAGRENIPVVIFDSGIGTDQFVAKIATDNYRA